MAKGRYIKVAIDSHNDAAATRSRLLDEYGFEVVRHCGSEDLEDGGHMYEYEVKGGPADGYLLRKPELDFRKPKVP